MKLYLKIIFAGLLVIFLAQNGLADDYDFRKTKWGMSIKQVKSSEPLKVVKEEENLLLYETSIIGKDVFVGYFFIDNQLVRARYGLAESHTNKNDFLVDYNDFKEILSKKYGKPTQDEKFWKNDLYKDDYSQWGMAISVGHLSYVSNWETQETEITNLLWGENFEIQCIVEYSSKSLKKIEEKAKEKKALDVF